MPPSHDPLRAGELLCARISHDLSSMIGTLAGALELTNDPAVAAEALALARQAATELRQLLELQRASWGPPAAALSLPALRTMLAEMPFARRCVLDLDGLPRDTVFAPAFGRVVLNLLLLAIESLNGSGAVTLTGGGTDLVVALAGPRAAWPAGLPGCLASEAGAWAALHDPATLRMPLTALLARSLGLRLSLLVPAGPPTPAPPLRLQKV